MSRAAILTYHSISEGPPPLAISPSVFAEQMGWLATNARVVPLGEIVAALKNRERLPPRCVALTFDDGYQDFLLHALPVLQRHQFPVTVFLPTDHCGGTDAWSGFGSGSDQHPLMDWKQIDQLAGEGIEFGSHGASHAALDKVSPEVLEREVSGSKRVIHERLGRIPDFFCYPYGIWNARARDAVRQHYQAACSTGAGLAEGSSDLFALPRVDAHYVRSSTWFERLFRPSFTVYLSGRRLIRRLRGRPEGYVSKAGTS